VRPRASASPVIAKTNGAIGSGQCTRSSVQHRCASSGFCQITGKSAGGGKGDAAQTPVVPIGDMVISIKRVSLAGPATKQGCNWPALEQEQTPVLIGALDIHRPTQRRLQRQPEMRYLDGLFLGQSWLPAQHAGDVDLPRAPWD